LNLLSYRPRTKRELLRRLKQKKYDVRTAEETVSKLERSGLINDYSFAKLFIETFRDRRGIYRLKNDLFKHGVEKTIIEKVLKEVPVNENKTAKKLIDKWLRTHKTRDEKVKSRLLNFLVQRGISWDTISELRNYIKTIIS
ncbi:regulatory protein RecX, partial [candidate division WOR-3 bacterium]|nr:regulatory protein RecX [candidate division WOR-3 bacterium]